MIGPVDLVVAVQALAGQYLGRGSLRRNPGAAVSHAGVVPGVVALLAEPGTTAVEKGGVVGTMRLVAGAAILANRLVFEHKGAALFSVAFVAGFIDGVLHQAGFACRTMGFVAIGTGHQADVRGCLAGGLHRVPLLAHELGALFGMAGVANFRLALHRQHRVVLHVQVVAVDTGGLLDVVHAAHPVES